MCKIYHNLIITIFDGHRNKELNKSHLHHTAGPTGSSTGRARHIMAGACLWWCHQTVLDQDLLVLIVRQRELAAFIGSDVLVLVHLGPRTDGPVQWAQA